MRDLGGRSHAIVVVHVLIQSRGLKVKEHVPSQALLVIWVDRAPPTELVAVVAFQSTAMELAPSLHQRWSACTYCVVSCVGGCRLVLEPV